MAVARETGSGRFLPLALLASTLAVGASALLVLRPDNTPPNAPSLAEHPGSVGESGHPMELAHTEKQDGLPVASGNVSAPHMPDPAADDLAALDAAQSDLVESLPPPAIPECAPKSWPTEPPRYPDPDSAANAGSEIEPAEELPPAESNSPKESVAPSYLRWLADHQNEEGFWSPHGFDDDSLRKPIAGIRVSRNVEFVAPGEAAGDKGTPDSQLMTTALALAVIVGAGYDHKEGDYKQHVRRALQYLKKLQRSDGSFEGARDLRDHALVALAWMEIWGLSQDQAMQPTGDKAMEYLLAQRVPGSGWGSGPGHEANVLDTFYAVRAIGVARVNGWEGDVDAAMAEAARFVAPLRRDDGQVWYTATQPEAPRSQVAGFTRGPINEPAWVMVMVMTGASERTSDEVATVIHRVLQPGALPVWAAGRVDYEQWWIASLACWQLHTLPFGSDTIWDTWVPATFKMLLDRQRGFNPLDKAAGLTTPKLLDEHGSWDALSPWSDGGRIEATGFAQLTLEHHYRRTYRKLSSD